MGSDGQTSKVPNSKASKGDEERSAAVWSVYIGNTQARHIPQICLFGMEIILSEDKWDPKDSGRAFCLSLNGLKEVGWRARNGTEITKGICKEHRPGAMQGIHKVLETKVFSMSPGLHGIASFCLPNICFPSLCELPSSPWCPRLPLLHFSSEWPRNPNCLTAWSPHAYEIKFVLFFSPNNLLVITSLLVQPKNLEG